MKKYRRKTPLFSPAIVAIAAFGAAIATILARCFLGRENGWIILCGFLFIILIVACLFLLIPVGYKYAYKDTTIELFYSVIKYGRVKYIDFSYVFISNASYNNGYGYGVYGNIPMKKTEKKRKDVNTTVYPYLTLHKGNYPIQRIKKAMNSRDLFMIDNYNVFCLGICWESSLIELLNHTDIPIYVLEDVYLRFKEMFDTLLLRDDFDTNRFFVVMAQETVRMNGTGDGSLFQKSDN